MRARAVQTHPFLTALVSGATLCAWLSVGSAQTFDSGSTGADGALTVSSTTTLALPPDGVFNFTTLTVQSGATLSFTPNAANTPVTILATGDVFIFGSMTVNGNFGVGAPFVAAGGPGGFPGGVGGTPPAGGAGPGGGLPGGSGGNLNAFYGPGSSFGTLLPLFGGSGGGGGIANSFGQASSGGGGGGAIVIASNTRVHVSGSLTARGGGGTGSGGNVFRSGGGSGGAIRLVAPRVTGAGTLTATGGPGGLSNFLAGSGRIRLESDLAEFTGSTSPGFFFSTTLGPVTAASTPSTGGLPSVTFSAVAGFAPPVSPTGSYANTDVALPQGTSNPVSVLVTARNVPVGTVFTVKVMPQLTDPTTFFSLPTTGSFAHATATASVTLPVGEVSQLLAFGEFTVPEQLAARYPLIEGEPVERVLVAARMGEAAAVTWVTRSGKAVPASRAPVPAAP